MTVSVCDGDTQRSKHDLNPTVRAANTASGFKVKSYNRGSTLNVTVETFLRGTGYVTPSSRGDTAGPETEKDRSSICMWSLLNDV